MQYVSVMSHTLAQPGKAPRLIIVMGVSGSGKSTIGKALGEATGFPFIDADHLHPQSNVEKMRAGHPLEDSDRWPWLQIVGAELAKTGASSGGGICACSALKRSYRDMLTSAAGAPIVFVMLEGERSLIAQRQSERPGHFMPPSLLTSQFETLEPLGAGERGIVLDVSRPVDELLKTLLSELQRMSTV